MSERDKKIHDPLIETVEESDGENEEPVSTPRPMSEHVEQSDSAHDMVSYNGDSLVASGSPFKKSYSATSLGETSVDALVDEPLPIESVALSPFRIDSIHNSSLPSSQKDSHTFPVSVSDSLPPHVMELDSPERIDDQDDTDFCVDKVPPEEEEDFFTEEKNISDPSLIRLDSTGNISSLLISSEDEQNVKEESRMVESMPAKESVPFSQEDLFESQESAKGSTSSTSPQTPGKKSTTSEPIEDLHQTDSSNKISGNVSEPSRESGEILIEEDIIPASVEPKHSAETVHPTSIKLSKETVLPAASPVKRKREVMDDCKTSEEKANKKDRKESKEVGEVDSDVEILDSSSTSPNQSIKVVYDKKVYDSENVESQDLNLNLTENTQPETEERHVESNSSLKNEKNSSQSQSLISMPSSDNLICKDTFSSFEENTPVESTIRPTQVELLCKPASPPTQPNIKSLINSPIIKNKESCEGGKSTNESSCSNSFEVVSTTTSSHFDTQESVQTSSVSRTKINPIVSFPYFNTPSQITQESQECLESVFVKAKKAAEKLNEEEKQEKESRPTLGKLIDSFDTPPAPEIRDGIKGETLQSLNGNPDQYAKICTPVCAINPTKSSQSTPISSQVNLEPSKSWLFSNISHGTNSSSEKTVSQKPRVTGDDSDDEENLSGNSSTNHNKNLNDVTKNTGNFASTPNESSDNLTLDKLKEGGSTISKDSLFHTAVDSSESHSSNQNSLDLSKAGTETIERESESIQCVKDLVDAGWTKIIEKNICLQCWKSPKSGEIVFCFEGEEEVIKETTPIGSIMSLIKKSTSSISSSSSKDASRISGISSISRITTSSSGYLGDKSSSSGHANIDVARMESTRLSLASVYTISPPRSYIPQRETDGDLAKTELEGTNFTHPLPVSSVLPKIIKVSTETQTDFELRDSSTSDEPTSKYKHYRGRGRPRGRGKGKGRSIIEKKDVAIPASIEEDNEITNSAILSVKNEEPKPLRGDCDNNDDFYSLLPPFLQEKLRTAQIPLTEDEEEIFVLQKNRMNKDEQKVQFEEVLRKVRTAKIKPGSLVFARYIDKNYYSAMVNNWVKEDRWQVKYSLDDYVNIVREVYILPTEILPKGIACHVRHPKQKFSDPGIVKGHLLLDNGILTHIIEIHKGNIVKATHSHIILSPEVANLFMEPRLTFNSMIASPGGDVSLDNIVPGKRRRESSSSPQKRIQAAFLSSPRYRKPDSNLDTTESEKDTKRKVSKSVAVATAYSETSDSTDLESLPATSSETPRSSRKRKMQKVPRTPKSSNSSTKSAEGKASASRVPKTRSGAKTKLSKPVVEEGKSSKKLFDSNDNGTSKIEKLPEVLMNPVVELIQLEEVSPSPKSSPKSTPKKKGRKPGSSPRNPRKTKRIEESSLNQEDEDELVTDIDPRLGPLPPAGSQLFKGYSILITRASPSHSFDEERNDTYIPLDKEYLKEQISLGGGVVIETFEEAYRQLIQSLQSKKTTSVPVNKKIHSLKTLPASSSPAKILCISNSCCRTAKFIQCLTVGIPLVGSDWIINSIKKNACQNWLRFLLPAGMSLLTGCSMEQSIDDEHKDVFSNVGNVIEVVKGEKVFLATSSNPEFGELWLNLLNVAKADVFVMPPKGGNLKRLIDRKTLVIADASIPEEELKRAKEANVPIVSSEWFIQSLIARCKLQYDAHPEFNYAHKLHKNSQVERVVENSNDN